jgi:hypothetical protein
MANTVKLKAEMSDGRELVAVCDQRDYAGWEAAGLDGSITRLRWLAWSSLHRSGEVKAWAQFAVDCVEVTDAEPDGSEEEQGLDPGRKAPRAGR